MALFITDRIITSISVTSRGYIADPVRTNPSCDLLISVAPPSAPSEVAMTNARTKMVDPWKYSWKVILTENVTLEPRFFSYRCRLHDEVLFLESILFESLSPTTFPLVLQMIFILVRKELCESICEGKKTRFLTESRSESSSFSSKSHSASFHRCRFARQRD